MENFVERTSPTTHQDRSANRNTAHQTKDHSINADANTVILSQESGLGNGRQQSPLRYDTEGYTEIPMCVESSDAKTLQITENGHHAETNAFPGLQSSSPCYEPASYMKFFPSSLTYSETALSTTQDSNQINFGRSNAYQKTPQSTYQTPLPQLAGYAPMLQNWQASSQHLNYIPASFGQSLVRTGPEGNSLANIMAPHLESAFANGRPVLDATSVSNCKVSHYSSVRKHDESSEEGYEDDFEEDDVIDGDYSPEKNLGLTSIHKQSQAAHIGLQTGIQSSSKRRFTGTQFRRHPTTMPPGSPMLRPSQGLMGSSFGFGPPSGSIASPVSSPIPGNAIGFSVPSIEPKMPSRYSGFDIPPSVNMHPIPTPALRNEQISDAALLKRGLTRTESHLVAKRATGANDPENVQIINMVDNKKMKWPDIARTLNEARTKAGSKKMLTANCVHNRYNRNAPVLYNTEGKVFIPIHLRKHAAQNGSGQLGSFFWDDDRDRFLAQTVKNDESERWQRVANKISQATGGNVTPLQCSTRYDLI